MVTFGTLAAFYSENQAGTAALILIGSVLMLIAIQGTAIRRATTQSIDLARRASSARTVDSVKEALADGNTDLARGVIEGAKAADPGLDVAPAVRLLREQHYAREAMDAVRRIAEQTLDLRTRRKATAVEMALGTNQALQIDAGQSPLALAVYRGSTTPPDIFGSNFAQIMRGLRDYEQRPIVLVTNRSPEFGRMYELSRVNTLPQDPPVLVVEWRDARDDDQLRDVLERATKWSGPQRR
ncbi:hypothetical protein BJF78_36220 [Pseudonocardia sp. CNS-139]|nr:hypothetical protein BJF78_36220 [Pseudonocardia sp. CNS-139]